MRSSGDHRDGVPLAGAPRRPEDVAGEDDRTGERKRSRRAGKASLKGGEARGKEKEANGSKIYLFPRLSRSPDVSGSRAGRRRSLGRSGRRPSLAKVGAASECSSGASQIVRRKLRSTGGGSTDLGSQVAAGGRGGVLLLVGLDGALWEIAGGAGSGSGWLKCFLGGCGVVLELSRFSGLKMV